MKIKRAQYHVRGPVPQDVIEAVEFDLAPLESGQVLVEVLAAAINPSDVLTLTGEYGMLPPLPAIGGNEGVGRIQQVGPDVDAARIGQTVLLPVGCGTWSTHVVVPAKGLVVLPGQADPRQLAMLTVNPPTALLMLTEFVTLEPGEWVIQNAANSAVGGYLMQIARLRGWKTVNVVRRDSAVAAVRAEGGDVVLVDNEDLHKQVREATGDARIRLGIDAVGGAATDHLTRCLANGATVVNYGAMSGEPCHISPGSFVFKDITLRGFWLAKWFRTASPEQQASVFGEIVQLIATGKLKARVQATFGIDEIKQALAMAASGARAGKVLIVPTPLG
jgi:mitochondrial enoyl-[acyl-carrier protein] reductase / trans-2-enoyl-CoA reductase